MKKQGKILVVDDNRNILSSLRLLLDDVFEDVMTLPSPKTMLNVLAQGVDAVLLDMNFVAGINNGNEGLYWLHKINDKFPDVPVVLFTAYADVELAVQAMKDGAFDFVEKPWDNTRLIDTLMRAVKSRLESAPANPAPTEMVWGQSEAMLRLKTLVEKVARTDANVLITGENGTGKDVLAHELHRLSARVAKPMVCVDMGAITDTLFESELFGHVKGAFTDARTDRKGLIEEADGGTLFLDEIGKVIGRSVARSGREVTRDLIAPGAVERIFRRSHELKVSVAHLFEIRHNLVGKLAVGIGVAVGVSSPRTYVRLVNVHRRSVDILFLQLLAVSLVVYFYRRQRENLAVRSLVSFRVQRVGVGLVKHAPVRRRYSEFIAVKTPDPLKQRFPHSASGALHRRAAPIVEVAHDLDAIRGGCENPCYRRF